MDKIKLHSPIRNIIPQHVIDNSFKLINSNTSTKNGYSYRDIFENERGIILDINSYGSFIKVNPTKFVCGHNITQINRTQFLSFIDEFEDHLQTSVGELKVSGFDFNQNVVTRYPVMRYIPLFRGLARYNKHTPKEGNGSSYYNKCKSFAIYDKVAEATRRMVEIPPEYQNIHLMRLEYGVTQKVSQNNDFAGISTLRTLGELDNYGMVIHNWKKMYDKIEKQPLYFNEQLQKPDGMSHADYILLFYINSHGFENHLNQINDEKISGRLSRGQAKRRREEALDVWQKYQSMNNGHDLLHELDNLVEEKYQHCMAELLS